jgi:hypothetical protein
MSTVAAGAFRVVEELADEPAGECRVVGDRYVTQAGNPPHLRARHDGRAPLGYRPVGGRWLRGRLAVICRTSGLPVEHLGEPGACHRGSGVGVGPAERR